MSPPVCPWSLINPPINAIWLPSEDHRGTAICSPCSDPETFVVSRIDLGCPPAISSGSSCSTHQLFSPGGFDATNTRCFESGDQPNSYACNVAGVTCENDPFATSTTP